jgi:integrase
MASYRKKGKVWYYRFVDGDGIPREAAGCPDRRATEDIARKVETEAARIRAGELDPRDEAFRLHESHPLADHLTHWHAYLTAKGATRQHALLSLNRSRRIIDLARVSRISDLAPSKIQAALKTIRDEGATQRSEERGVSLRSLHHYTRAVKGFTRWLWKDGRARLDALAHLTSPNPAPDRRHERRALTAEEQAKLVQTAESGPIVYKMSGPDRAALYLVAGGTGFRANELRSLTPESFDLDGAPPTVTVKAAYSKRRRDDVQPIRPDLAEFLVTWLAAKPAGKPVFGNLTKHTSDMMQHDLKAAKIPYRDADGRVADFHSLRHSYVSMLARSPAPVKVVQTLARHSTPTLTLGVYSHIGILDQTAALDALPPPGQNHPDRGASHHAGYGYRWSTHKRKPCPLFAHRRFRGGSGWFG